MVRIEDFGRLDGEPVREITLRAPSGATASILTFGAVLRDLRVPMRDGAPRPVVLGFDDLASYRDNPGCIGASIGRCANRIGGARFRLDGRDVALLPNEGGRNTLHGGPIGFGRRLWRIEEASETMVDLALTSPDGEEGWPGRVEARCRYALEGEATLTVDYSATCDAPTPVNLTNHAYFNLGGGSSLAHRLRLHADLYTPVDEALVPTGAILPVAGTPFDFRTMRPIERDYDIAFVLAGAPGERVPAAEALSPDGRLRLDVATGEPVVQLYTAGFLGESARASSGLPHGGHAGFCLETHGFVDAPNHRHFPSVVLRPGERRRQTTVFAFTALG
ncbi:MAG: galactose mutarotase [Hyphomicrobiales bacterium]|nr:galactose mutarotase [Hyphomicrobiales bacterium]